MGDGFKKYFNSTTMSGRANVAKATYAALAVFYLIYRVRRGKGEPSKEEVLLQPNFSCEEKPSNLPTNVPPERECIVCRERRPRENNCEPSREPPSPPPPSAPARRKCPCEDSPRSQVANKHQQPPVHQNVHQAPPQPQMQQLRPQQSYIASPTEIDEAHPAREIITQVHEAAARVLRNVIGAVMGDATAINSDGVRDENCNCCNAAAATAAAAEASASSTNSNDDMIDVCDQADDEASDYETDQLFNRQRRTAPRACVPSSTSSDPDSTKDGNEFQNDVDFQEQKISQTQTHSQSKAPSQLQSKPKAQSQAHPRYRCFEDNFASEMFFEDFEE